MKDIIYIILQHFKCQTLWAYVFNLFVMSYICQFFTLVSPPTPQIQLLDVDLLLNFAWMDGKTSAYFKGLGIQGQCPPPFLKLHIFQMFKRVPRSPPLLPHWESCICPYLCLSRGLCYIVILIKNIIFDLFQYRPCSLLKPTYIWLTDTKGLISRVCQITHYFQTREIIPKLEIAFSPDR